MRSKKENKQRRDTKASNAGELLEQAVNTSGTTGAHGMGAGTGYDVAGQVAVPHTAQHAEPGGSHETSGLGATTGRGTGSDAPDSTSNRTGSGTGGMTGVGGSSGRTGDLVSSSDTPISHGSTSTPIAGGVAVPGGRGSDLGDADHSYGGAPTGYSSGTTGGSNEQDVGGGLSGGMRSGTGSDATGGIGTSHGITDDPTDGSADVSPQRSTPFSHSEVPTGDSLGRDIKDNTQRPPQKKR